MKTLGIYMPLSWGTIDREVFKSFLDITSHEIRVEIEQKYDMRIVHLIHDAVPLDFNRNDAVERLINDYKADYILFLDGDMVWPKNMILSLLKLISDDFPIVTGDYYKKLAPHASTLGQYCQWDANIEKHRKSLAEQGLITKDGAQCLFFNAFPYREDAEPFVVDVFGLGCALIRSDVFKRLEQPYFKYINGYSTGDHSFRRSCEAMWFCAQLKKAEISVLCDPKVQCGHLAKTVINYRGSRENGRPKIEVIQPILMEVNE